VTSKLRPPVAPEQLAAPDDAHAGAQEELLEVHPGERVHLCDRVALDRDAFPHLHGDLAEDQANHARGRWGGEHSPSLEHELEHVTADDHVEAGAR